MIFKRSALAHWGGWARRLAVLIMLFMLLTNLDVGMVGAASTSTTDSASANWLHLKDGQYRPGELIVKFRDPASGKRLTNQGLQPERLLQSELVQSFGVTRFETIEGFPGFVRYYADSQTDLNRLASALSLDPQVEVVEPNRLMHIARLPNDPLYRQTVYGVDGTSRQWYLKKINIEKLWDVTTGNNQVIAVLDTGINPFQSDLNGAVDQSHSYNFIAQPPNAPANNGITAVWDDNGHGTAVAGIIGANTNNQNGDSSYEGIAGINWHAIMLSVKVADANGTADSVAVARGIQFATNNQARIINLSLPFNPTELVGQAVQYAQSAGVLIVTAAGNDSTPQANTLSGYSNVITVGATDRNDAPTSFTNPGKFVSVAAPGVDIFTTYCYFFGASTAKATGTNSTAYAAQGCTNPDPKRYVGGTVLCNNSDPNDCYRDSSTTDNSVYAYVSGTSFAAPIVTGLASLIVASVPNVDNKTIKSLLESTATDVTTNPGKSGRDDYTGFGRVDAGALADKISAGLSSGDFSSGNHKSFVQGVVTGANPNDVLVNLDPPNISKSLDPSNNGFRFDDLAPQVYQLRVSIPKRGIVLGPVELHPTGNYGDVINVNFDVASGGIVCGERAICPGAQNPTPGQPTTPAPPPPNALAPNSVFFNSAAPLPGAAYFPDTGHNLSGSFRTYWEGHGGLTVFGFPISEEFQEVSNTDGQTYTVQYFQRNRFEFHPANNDANKVLLGLLGSELTRGRNFPPGAPIPNTATSRYFAETGHTLSDRFLSYWLANGGLEIFGYPISEPIQEGPYLVQYFERNRFELHPENRSPYDVLLGLLGSDLARSRNYIR